jgi:transposase
MAPHDDRDLYRRILGIENPWHVTDVQLDVSKRTVLIQLDTVDNAILTCPSCGKPCGGYDRPKARRWRHLDTCQMQTIIEASIPRIECADHGVLQIATPWAEPKSGFTALFEAMVILLIAQSSHKAVAELVGISWDEVDGIMQRAVDRGLQRRERNPVPHIGLDETSYQKRHEYVTIILDRDRNIVLDVLNDRTTEDLSKWLKDLPKNHLEAIQTVSMDMWWPYISAVTDIVPEAKSKICFDRFHVAQHFGKGVDKVRAEEHRELRKVMGRSPLFHMKHDFLRNASKIDNRTRPDFMKLVKSNLRTARAWAIKSTQEFLWEYSYRGAAENAWRHLLGWMSRCQLPPMVKVGNLVRDHLPGILNSIILKVSNSRSEAKNSGIQKVKSRACGFRNRERFRRAILFHFGGLDLLPAGVRYLNVTHSKP